MPSRIAIGRLHYAWIIAAVIFVVALLTAGVRAAPGVLIVPFEAEFGWSRATISFAIGVNLLLYGAVGPFAAAIMDRFGVRRTMSLALAVTGCAVALTPTMHESWQLLLLWGFVVGLATGFLGWYLSAYIAARWFRARQGVVMGVLTASNAAGQLVFLPTMAWLTANAGWRTMCLATTGLFAFLGGTASGWLSDRWDNRFLLFWYYGLRGLSLMYLPFAFDMSFYGLSLFSIFYGLDWIATGPPTARLMSGIVGIERTGMMIAWITVIHQVGGAGAAFLGGMMRISFGTYLEAFILSGLLCIGAALAVLFIGSDRRRLEPAVAPLPA